jgi:hypothetical protein
MIIGLLCYMIPDLKYDREVRDALGIFFIVLKWFLFLLIIAL